MSLVVVWNCGFFSNCSVKLNKITDFVNENKKIPDSVDSSGSFRWYKKNLNEDITFEYFEHYDNLDNVEYSNRINYHNRDQFKDYSKIDYKNISPILKKYFSPSENICNIITNLEKKYYLDYKNTCVLFYRGNDKIIETKICDYNEYIEYAEIVLKKNNKIKFLIQSDETEFIEFIQKKYPNNSFFFKDEIRHMKKCKSTVDKVMKNKNYEFSKYYLGITIIMSKCEYIICGSGNCSIWIMLYRENCKNTFQNLNSKWIVH